MRSAVLALVIVFVFTSLALPLRDLVNQRNRINALYDRQQQAQVELKELNAQIAKWNDPSYVATQARERLHFVLPGQVGYVVLEAEAAPVLYQGEVTQRRSRAWYVAVWGGIERAGRTAAPLQVDK